MPLSKDAVVQSKKWPIVGADNMKRQESERSNTNKTISKGLIHLKSQNTSPQLQDSVNWPSIDFSSKASKAKGGRKNKLADVTPSESNFSFKSALCGNSLPTVKPKPAQINRPPDRENVQRQEDKLVVDDVPTNEWINVSNKRKNKAKLAEEQERDIDSSHANIDKAKKREQLKLTKRMIREQKIQEEKEFKRKDTRINVVSQDFIDSFRQNSSSSNSRSNVPKHISFQSSQHSTSTEQKKSLISHIVTTKRNKETTSGKKFNKAIPNLGQQMIAKKKVKTKDLINLNLVDLIKKKEKQPVVSAPIVKRDKAVFKKKPGKQSDVKKNKKSKLRKTIIRQNKVGRENFALYLAEIFQKNLTISEENPSSLASLKEDAESRVESTLPIHKTSQETPAVPISEECTIAEVEPKQIATTVHEPSAMPVDDQLTKLPQFEARELVTTEDRVSEDKNAYDSLKTFQIDLIKEINYLRNPLHSRKFREYCNHFVTPEINELLTEFLELIVKFQVRLYENDPLKGKTKRRFYCGLKESWKHVKKLTCVVIAPDIKCNASAGGLDELLQNILDKVASSNTSVVFGLNQRQLGRLSRRKCNVSCIGITNFQGAQDVHKKLMDAVNLQTEKYQKAKDSLIPDNINKGDEQTILE